MKTTRAYRTGAAMFSLLWAGFLQGEIAGSKHDFTATTWGDASICKPCHTPHNATNIGFDGAIWSHTLSTASYVAHGGLSFGQNFAGGPPSVTAAQGDMDGPTRLCLSCHDGTVALDSFLGKTGASDGLTIGQGAGHGSPDASVGTNLLDDHPVGYRALYIENEKLGTRYTYKPLSSLPQTMTMVLSPTAVSAGSLDQGGAPITSYSNWPAVSCITCHDVHNTSVAAEPGLLRISNQASQLCRTCHNL